MLNGQLKPGYNIQTGTENRYIVGFTIHPNPTDTKTMIPHLKHLEESLGRLPENIVQTQAMAVKRIMNIWKKTIWEVM